MRAYVSGTTVCMAGQGAINRDCPAENGTVGNYDIDGNTIKNRDLGMVVMHINIVHVLSAYCINHF